MSDSKQTDHWDLLASALGAEPQKKGAVETTTPLEENVADVTRSNDAQAVVRVSPGKTAAPKNSPRPSSNWDHIALSLGIEVKPAAAPPDASEEIFPAESPPREVGISKEFSRERSRPSGEESIQPADIFETAEALPDEESVQPREKKTHGRRRRRRKERDKDRVIAGGEKSFAVSERKAAAGDESPPADGSAQRDDIAGTEPERETEESEIERGRSKHRRSRRGSRKRKKKGDGITQKKGAPAEKVPASHRAESAAETIISVESASQEDVAEEEDEDRGKRGEKSAFRAIPTWPEAVGIIVTRNMESRPRRHGNASSSSRSAESREKRRR